MPYNAPKVRAPRAWLDAGTGRNILLKHCVVHQTRFQDASQFTAVMALDDDSNPGVMFWSGETSIPAIIYGTNGDGDSVPLMYGYIKQVDVDFEERIVTVLGYDRTTEMLSTRSEQKFPNMTSRSEERRVGKECR